jgi:uncharacterized protein
MSTQAPEPDAELTTTRGEQALEALRDAIAPLERVLVAYSGGVDSALVLAVGHEVLGANCTGVIGHSPSLAASELEDALATAREIGVAVEVVQTEELANEDYRANSPNRCFFCKDTLYTLLARLGRERNAYVVDGTHLGDLNEIRPGRRAAELHGVRSPLVEARLGKEDVRAAARLLGLRVWEKPAMACLASRIVHGVEVTAERLTQVGRAEALVRRLGFTQFRVRSHGSLVRLEVFPEDMVRVVDADVRTTLVGGLRELGFREITLDLAGLRDALRL